MRAPTTSSFALAALAALTCSGCILPVPHTRVHGYGVIGQVVDAADRKPIRGAEILGGDVFARATRSDACGRFRLRPTRGWHGACFIGPICLSLLPGWDITAPERTIRVSAPGYITTVFSIQAWGVGSTNEVAAVLTGAYLRAGELPMARQQGTTSDP